MTGEIVNLNRARKAKARVEKQRTAEQNRVLHGESKAARRLREAETRQRQDILEGARRSPGEQDDKT